MKPTGSAPRVLTISKTHITGKSTTEALRLRGLPVLWQSARSHVSRRRPSNRNGMRRSPTRIRASGLLEAARPHVPRTKRWTQAAASPWLSRYSSHQQHKRSRKGPGVKQQSNQGVCRAITVAPVAKPNVTVKGTLDIWHRFGHTALAPLTYWR
jgi:hypothetical protein